MKKNIIITGASSGLGKELALNFAKKKANLLLIARNKSRLNEVAILATKYGAKVISEICDVFDKDKLHKIILDFDNNYPVDLIIANAGVSAGTSQGSESLAQFHNILNINIYGVINSIHPLLSKFKDRKSGQIALVSSMAALHALPSAPAYSCSKICVKYYGDALRAELRKYNVKVNIIFPGYIKTAMTEKNNFPMPLLMNCDKAASKIVRGLESNNAYIIFPKVIYLVMKLLNIAPLYFQDKVFANLPKK
ncbi:MAG: SDR family NAD(P)-dependent oxidoreductase [Alphaproteobacteria bacterium]|jgi:short-subunit dehydrogenase|nr:SDR family NAD(P)-dependent oxidoreductase [Alphaproteobacteria bacterium]MBT5828469.1 SDR family NAD(P)-dependent oxidoreductase [Alphaproteobacteria bacterium]